MAESMRWFIPSVVTLGALTSGLSAVRCAAEEDFDTAVLCIMLAAVLDALDGHVARYLKACTKLGFELDSLCDLANFGVTPALVVYFWAKALPRHECRLEACRGDHTGLWIACCMYAACCAFRLARFNVTGHAEQMDKQHLKTEPGLTRRPSVPKAVLHNIWQQKMYFQGVPAPVAASYALTPLMLRFSRMPRALGAVGEVGSWAIGRRGTGVTLIITAVLMIAPLPTFSSKMLKTDRDDTHLRSRHIVSIVAKVLLGAALVLLSWKFPFEIMLVLNLLHFLSIPIANVLFYSCGVDKCE